MLRARLIATILLASLVMAALPSLAAPPAKHDAPAVAKSAAAKSEKSEKSEKSGDRPADKPAAAADGLKIVGPTGQAISLKAADLAALPRTTLKAIIHDKEYTFEGVQLTLLLAKVGTPTGKDLRGPEVSKVVLVTASDGYKLALSLVETDPRFRPNRIIVADKMDGQSLNEHDGPFRLVVEGDLDAARLVRNLASIEVRKID